jgi:hypothetical protein
MRTRRKTRETHKEETELEKKTREKSQEQEVGGFRMRIDGAEGGREGTVG